MCVSNGPAFSPDCLTAYHVDSPRNTIMEYNYRAKDGNFQNRRQFLDMNEDIGGYFDGGTTDADGNVWWAIWEGAKIVKINPNTKRVTQMIDIGEFKRPTSLTFGGKDYKTLLVTSCG